MRLDDTQAPIAALYASCQDAANQIWARRGRRPQAACIARETRTPVHCTSAPIATWPTCDPRGACSDCSKSAPSSACGNAAIRTTDSRAFTARDANGVRVRGNDAEGRRKLAQYMLRAPFSLEKMTYLPDTGMVMYRSHLHKSLKRNFQLMPGAQWLELLCRHIPDRFEHLVRSVGWYSTRCRGERAQVDIMPHWARFKVGSLTGLRAPTSDFEFGAELIRLS